VLYSAEGGEGGGEGVNQPCQGRAMSG
jgi:hypothetical protein